MARKLLSANEYIDGVLSEDRFILGKAITLIESEKAEDQLLANEVLEALIPKTGKSMRIGITGVPGVGKSTFIESFGNYIIEQGRKLAVLAVDPSSQSSHGSILGDKTRMESLATNDSAFIRPSPAKNVLGGAAAKTKEVIHLCEAAGFNTIFVETVGVGQSEIAVKQLVDHFLLLMLSGAGDELQGIKKGIMEMADSIIINKVDGDNVKHGQMAKARYINALQLFPAPESNWIPKVELYSSVDNTGREEIWEMLNSFFEHIKDNGFFKANRINQNVHWFHQTVRDTLLSRFYSNNDLHKDLIKMEAEVKNGNLTPLNAANKILYETTKK